MERKYLTFSEFIYNNPNGDGYYQTSTESIYPRIIITKKKDPLFIQDAMDFGFVDRIYLSPNCEEIVTPQTRGSVDYPSTRGIQVDVGLPDATSENRAESPLHGELYPITVPA